MLAGLAAPLALWAADFDATRWQYRCRIYVDQPDRMQVLVLNRGIYERSRPDLGDLRVTRNGREVPYLLEALPEKDESREAPAKVIDRAVLSGTGLQVTLDAGERKVRHSQVRLVTGEKNFRQLVRLEASDDARNWFTVRENGYIFDFSEGGRRAQVLDVDYPVSTRRYLRATIYGWQRTDAVEEARLWLHERQEAVRDVVAAPPPSRREDPQTKSTLLELDLGTSGVPHDLVRLESDSRSFHRAVDVEYSDDGRDWRLLRHTVIYQIPGERSLHISFPERTERYLRLRIANGDDEPIAVTRVQIEVTRRQVKIPPYSLGGDYFLYFGNPAARPPVYDLSAVLSRQEPLPEASPDLRPWQRNPSYQPPPDQRPWTERHRALFYAVLLLSVAGMLLLTVYFLRKLKAEER